LYIITAHTHIDIHVIFLISFSKQSGKLIQKIFDKIQDLIEDHKSLVFLLIDEAESLASCRVSSESGNEPSDSIRLGEFSFKTN
jgi:hypothetical protein